jgi:hypothetical protein
MLENNKDYKKEEVEEYEDEVKPLTFDDMVSFTMFAEIFLIGLCIIIFLLYLLISS